MPEGLSAARWKVARSETSTSCDLSGQASISITAPGEVFPLPAASGGRPLKSVASGVCAIDDAYAMSPPSTNWASGHQPHFRYRPASSR